MYEILIVPAAQEQFDKLEKQVQERISAAFERIQTRPEAYAIKLVGRPGYKLRIGDYRALLHIDYQNKIILIAKVGHRKNVYDGL